MSLFKFSAAMAEAVPIKSALWLQIRIFHAESEKLQNFAMPKKHFQRHFQRRTFSSRALCHKVIDMQRAILANFPRKLRQQTQTRLLCLTHMKKPG